MIQRRNAMFGLVLGLAAMMAVTPVTHAQGAPSGTKVAVVNLREAYSKLAGTKELQSHLGKMQSDLEAMQNSHKAQIEDFQHQINNVKVNSQQHSDMMDKLDDMQLDFKRQETLQQVKMVRAQNHQIVAAYKAIQGTVADLAKKRGFDLVLVNTDTDVPDNAGDIANQETVANLIFGRNVLFASDKINITADVITAVDAGSGAAPAGK
jgi:Skp family chaperone for outer membrane proteins